MDEIKRNGGLTFASKAGLRLGVGRSYNVGAKIWAAGARIRGRK